MNFKNSLSYLIANQLPDYIRQEYPQFVLFLEKYYEFLDQDNEVNNLLLNAASWSDINETLDVFLPKFSDQHLQMFPTNTLVSDRVLIKFIREFYEAKGSEKAIEFLFRAFFNETPEIIYPSKYMLKASDGIWLREQVVRIKTNDTTLGDPFELPGKFVKVYCRITKPIPASGVDTFAIHDMRVLSVSKLAYSVEPTYELVVEHLEDDVITLPGSGAGGVPLIVDGKIMAVTANPADRSYTFDPGENSQAYVAATDDDPGDYFAEDYMTTVGSSVGLRYGRIQMIDHGLSEGDIVIYDPGAGNEPIGGLISYRHYYVKPIDKDYVRLYGDKIALNKTPTKTFFSSDVVDIVNNTITIPNHGFLTGDLVIYQNAVSPIGGLQDRTSYYVIKVNDNTIKLAENLLDADPRYVEDGYFANKLNEEDSDDSQPYMSISAYTAVAFSSVGAGNYHLFSKEYFINFTAIGTGAEHRFIDALDSVGSGYSAAPAVKFVGDVHAENGASARAILDGNGGVAYVSMLDSGIYHDANDTNVEFDNTENESYIYLESDPQTRYGYISRGISGVSVVSTTGTAPYGFKVNEVYEIIESGTAGAYVYTYRDDSLNYFAGDYVKTGVDNKASVQVTAVNSQGAPTALTVFSSGTQFEEQEFEYEITSKTGSVATIKVTTGAITKRPGRNKNRQGMLSDVNMLQDNYYYQNYSYVIRSKIPSINWMTMVKNTAHPAGMAVFGELLVRNTISFEPFNINRQPIDFYDQIIEVMNISDDDLTVVFLKELNDVATMDEQHEVDFRKPLADATDGATDNAEVLVGKGFTETQITTELQTFDVEKSLSDLSLMTEIYNVDVVKLLTDATNGATDDHATDIFKYIDKTTDVVETSLYMDPNQPAYFAEDYVTGADVILSAIDYTQVTYQKSIQESTLTTEIYNVTYHKVLTETVTTSDVVGSERVTLLNPETASVSESLSGSLQKSVSDTTTASDSINSDYGPAPSDSVGVNENFNTSSSSGGVVSTAHLMEEQSSTVSKQTSDTVGTSDSGVINIQDYWAGDYLAGDYVGTNYSI